MIHRASMECADNAESLIAKGDEASLRYACLELRMAIEYLFYAMIPSYADEVPTDLMQKWQPKRIIDALVDCDPNVEGSGSLALGGSDGTPMVAYEFKGANKQLIKDYWHKLGSYLHAPMQDSAPDWSNAVPFLSEAIAAVREYRNVRVLVNFREFVQFECTCGRQIKRNSETLKINPRITCPDVKCGQLWEPVDGDCSRYDVVRSSFICPNCKTSNRFDARFATAGTKLICDNCEVSFFLKTRLLLEPLEAAATESH